MQNRTAVMHGHTPSFAALVMEKQPLTLGMHCCADWLVLVLETWPIPMKEVFSAAVKVVNFTRAGPLNDHFLKKFGSKVE